MSCDHCGCDTVNQPAATAGTSPHFHNWEAEVVTRFSLHWASWMSNSCLSVCLNDYLSVCLSDPMLHCSLLDQGLWGSLVEVSRSFCCSQEWFQGFHSHVSGTRRLLLLTCHFHLINMCVCAEKETLDLHMEQKLLSWAQQKEWKLETAESGANVKKWAKTEAHTNVQVWKSWSQRT